jgi:hypothetical protein
MYADAYAVKLALIFYVNISTLKDIRTCTLKDGRKQHQVAISQAASL